MWFHAQALPGSHVVLITEGQVIPKELIAKQLHWLPSTAKENHPERLMLTILV